MLKPRKYRVYKRYKGGGKYTNKKTAMKELKNLNHYKRSIVIMKFSKKFLWLIVLLICLSSIAFFGNAANTEEMTLTIWKFAFGEQQNKVFDEWVDEYKQEHPNITFKYEEFPWGTYFEKLTISMSGGKGPDIFWISPGDFIKYAEMGVLYPFNDFLPQDVIKNTYSRSIEAVTIDGKILGLPWEGLDIVTLFYNKEMLAEAGVLPPTTWEELTEAAKKLTTKDRYGLYLYPEPGISQNFYWYPFLWQAGGKVVNENMTKSLFNSPATIKALKLWGDLMKYGAIPRVSPPDPLATGRVAMMVRGPFVISTWKKKYPDFYDKWDVTALPYPKDGEKLTVYGGFNLVVNAMSKHPEEAVNFVVWLFSDDEKGARWLTELKTSISANKVVRENQIFKDSWSEWPQYKIPALLSTALPEPAYPPEIVEAVTEAIQAVLYGNISPEDAAKNADEKIEKYLRNRK